MLETRDIPFGEKRDRTMKAIDLSLLFMDMLTDANIPLSEFENIVYHIIKLGKRYDRFFPKNVKRSLAKKTKTI